MHFNAYVNARFDSGILIHVGIQYPGEHIERRILARNFLNMKIDVALVDALAEEFNTLSIIYVIQSLYSI